MLTYLTRRFLQGVVMLGLSSFLIYSILLYGPGGPLNTSDSRDLCDPLDRPRCSASLISSFHLDQPWPLNYLAWLFRPVEDGKAVHRPGIAPIELNLAGFVLRGSGALTGDFGSSLSVAQGSTSSALVSSRFGNTALLVLLALLTSALVALPLGFFAVLAPRSRLERMASGLARANTVIPTFLLCLLLILLFSRLPLIMHAVHGWEWVPYLPPSYAWTPGQETNLVNRIYHLVLPVSVLAFANLSLLLRFVRISLVQALSSPYVLTADAKGLPAKLVVFKHVLPNALIPLLPVIVRCLPQLFFSAVVAEAVFNYAGMGDLFYRAVLQMDLTIVMQSLFVFVLIAVLANFLSDAISVTTNPRAQAAVL